MAGLVPAQPFIRSVTRPSLALTSLWGSMPNTFVPGAGGEPDLVVLQQVGVDEDPQVRGVPERLDAAADLWTPPTLCS